MIGLLQRVSTAEVRVDDAVIASIDTGLLVLVGVQPTDDAATGERLLDRLLGYRVFPDAEGRMNRSLSDTGGGLLLVPQFTLAADTRKGTRPGFSTAATPESAEARFSELCDSARQRHAPVGVGQFGADMQVQLCNDGPVTFWLEVPGRSRSAG